MSERSQIPRVAEIIGPGITALAVARPTAMQYANTRAGRYGDVFNGWETQVSLLVRRLADEVVSARARLAKGGALTQLAASEFDTQRSATATQAIGRITLTRPIGGTRPGGAFPAGFRFRRPAVTGPPSITGADYVVARDTGAIAGATSATIPIVAARAGRAANAPYVDGTNAANGIALPQFGDTPFDPAFTVASFETAGGSDGEDDEDLRRQALAYGAGQYGPTLQAIVAGALRGTGVHRIAVFEVTSTTSGGIPSPAAFTNVVIADRDWGSGVDWQAMVQQSVYDDFAGIGGVVVVSGVTNTRIRLDATVKLRKADYLSSTSEIDAAIAKAARAYFDDRPDWYTFRNATLRAAISRAHPKILACTSVLIRQLSSNAAYPDPVAVPIATPTGVSAVHYDLAQNGVNTAYTAAN